MQAALNFTPMSESGKQKLQEKVAPSRSAWQEFPAIACGLGRGCKCLVITLQRESPGNSCIESEESSTSIVPLVTRLSRGRS